jgi:hypothetical protein
MRLWQLVNQGFHVVLFRDGQNCEEIEASQFLNIVNGGGVSIQARLKADYIGHY